MLWVALIAAIAISLLAYGGVSAYAYAQLGPVSAGCPPDAHGFQDVQEPTSFTPKWDDEDGAIHVVAGLEDLQLPGDEVVSFPARGDPAVTIVGWWEPQARADAPAVVVMHGRNGCRRNSGNLLAAWMLHRNGFAVLVIDMRNHGDSTVEGGQFAAGSDEYRDALGAWDWLRSKGVPAERIGLFGFSAGAEAALIAAGEEPGVAAVWADSSFADVPTVVDYGTHQQALPAGLHLPRIFAPGVILIGRLYAGHDLVGLSPVKAMPRLADRKVFLTQGEEDTYIGFQSLGILAEALRAAGGTPDVWAVPGAGHTMAHFLYPAEYETRLADFFSRALGAPASLT
jgi:dipeptidyl aminopeptidase/acylaminoacyl peptidase